jgi:hypothetical protein
MLDASLERVVVPFAYDDVHVAGVVVDQHLAQWCAVCSRRRLVGFPCPYGQEYCGLRRRKGPPFPASTHAPSSPPGSPRLVLVALQTSAGSGYDVAEPRTAATEW